MLIPICLLLLRKVYARYHRFGPIKNAGPEIGSGAGILDLNFACLIHRHRNAWIRLHFPYFQEAYTHVLIHNTQHSVMRDHTDY